MLKTLFTATIILFIACQLYAQKKFNSYFLTDKGKEVSTKDSADFIRIIEEPDSGSKLFILKEFYKNGTRKKLGKVSSFQPALIFEGQMLSFRKDGSKQASENYVNGKREGASFLFFKDGKINIQRDFFSVALGKDAMLGINGNFKQIYKLVYFADSTGKELVKDGSGYLNNITSIVNKDTLREEGNYKDGQKEGVWHGKFSSGISYFIEIYEGGKFVSGETFKDGIKYPYKENESPPKFSGGSRAWSKYVSENLRYPKEAMKDKLQGRVIVKFVVDVDGSTKNVEVVKSVDPLLDWEAVAIIEKSPKWIPGQIRGVPVKVLYHMPISFNLNF